MQSQVVWRADQLHRDVTERKQELDQLRLSASAANAQRSVGAVDNDLDTVEADKAVAERAKDEILRKQGRLRCWRVYSVHHVMALIAASHHCCVLLHPDVLIVSGSVCGNSFGDA